MTHELATLYEQRKAQWCCFTVEQRKQVRKLYDQLLRTHPAIPAFCVAVAEVANVARVAAETNAERGHVYH